MIRRTSFAPLAALLLASALAGCSPSSGAAGSGSTLPTGQASPAASATPTADGTGTAPDGDTADPPYGGSSGRVPTARPGRPGLPGGWLRERGLSWQWQLTGKLDLSIDADVYELDGFTTPATAVARLHASGRRAICYISAGAYEDFRPDADRYPPAVLGRPNGWSGERWVDVRRWDALGPILSDRFRMCRQKGFDAVEADNVDGYANESGFPLRPADQVAFNRRVAALAHSLGLAIGLKNDLDQVADLEPYFDFAVNEECFRYRECGRLTPFLRAGKPVFHVEYDLTAGRFCGEADRLGLISMVKRDDLDAWRQHC